MTAKPAFREIRDLFDRQTMTTASAAIGQHTAAALGCHAGTEAVSPLALDDTGLKSALHDAR